MAVFPECERVIYERNSLAEVVCQLRFPSILRIDASVPADFQEAIRSSYPLFSTNESKLPPGLPPELRHMVPPELIAAGAYEFHSEDKAWKLSLTKDFIALSTSAYTRWEEFRGQLEGPLKALESIYRPAFFMRIGLRYRNALDPEVLGRESTWLDLLKPEILGELGDSNIGPRIETSSRTVVIKLESGDRVGLRHGLGVNEQNQKSIYIIDADFHTSTKTEINDALAKLNAFNSESRRLFRWCITDVYHRAMEPKPA